MDDLRRKSIACAVFALSLFFSETLPACASQLAGNDAASIESVFPKSHLDLNKTISIDEMESFFKSVESPGFITVTKEGNSVGGRPIYLVRVCRERTTAKFRVFLYAQQHGDEVSGKDAILYLLRGIAEDPRLLPEDIDLYLMPMVNPDGAVAYRRRNEAGADLNRDHMILRQPETQALYRVARRVMPHLTADCHEFTRDGSAYAKRGWERWPLITMDVMNHLVIPDYLIEIGLQMLDTAYEAMRRAGHDYARYMVGGPPPDEEIRPSTTEVDDGRNGMGGHCAISLIIEAAVRRRGDDPQADLSKRVDAYLSLFWHILGTKESRANIVDLVERARKEALPPFVATNFFWANLNGRINSAKVIENATGIVREIPTANIMSDMVAKNSVPTPIAYIIDSKASAVFLPFLDSHGIKYTAIGTSEHFNVEPCKLLRIEDQYDDVYQRYENRVIVERTPKVRQTFPQGSIVVSLEQPLARRAIQLLEPCMLYSVYGYPEFKVLVEVDKYLPVYRVLK